MVFCPKCGYQRQAKDDDFVSKNECPKCGIVYDKFDRAQRQSNAGKKIIYLKKRKTIQPYFWAGAAWSLVIMIFIMTSNTTNRSVPIDSTAKSTSQNWQNSYSPSKSANNFPVVTTTMPPYTDSVREISNATDRIMRMYGQPLNSAQYYQNDLNEYQWDSIKSLPNYAKLQAILSNYHRQHAYLGNESFVCVDMAMEVWDLLTAVGIRSRLMIGNNQTDITQSSTVKDYLANMNHAWVLAEVSPFSWIALETTGGYIVEPSTLNFRLYNMGTMFENPKGFKDFNEFRKSMFATCSDIALMQDKFNRSYAGRPISGESTEYTGMMKQKIEDCELLVGKVTAFLQQR